MNQAHNKKIVAITPPGAIVDNTAFATTAVDTKGWDYAEIIVHFGAMDIAMAALSVSDSNDGTSYAAVSGANFASGTMVNGVTAALPPATADNGFYSFGIDLRYHKRYIDLQATGGDGTSGTYMTAFAILTRGEQAPNSMSERGYTGQILV